MKWFWKKEKAKVESAQPAQPQKEIITEYVVNNIKLGDKYYLLKNGEIIVNTIETIWRKGRSVFVSSEHPENRDHWGEKINWHTSYVIGDTAFLTRPEAVNALTDHFTKQVAKIK